MSKCIRIERTQPRAGMIDQAFLYSEGYCLADHAIPSKVRHHNQSRTFVATLDEAAELIEQKGFHIRMGDSFREASLIQPSEVRCVRT